MTQSKTPFIVVLSLALTMMLGPFSMDTYLPAFPVIGESLGISQQSVSLSVSVYVFALALGQLIGGALSDRYGRQRVLMSGLVIFAFSSIAIGMSDSLNSLLGGRAIQAIGAGLTLVSVPALVRDRVAGRDAAKLFSMMGFIMVLAPGIAPSVGSAILLLGSWHTIFFALAAYALLLVPLLVRVLFTGTGKVSRTKSPQMSLLARYKLVLSTKPALPFIVWQAASFSTLMMFITYASFIYQGHFGQSPSSFSLLFAANIVAMLIFNILNRILLSRLSSLRILQLATGCQAVGIVLLVMAAFMEWPLYAFLLAMMLTIGSIGAISPNIQACFLEFFPTSSGTAAALLGAAQFGIAGVLSALSALLPHTLGAVILAMAACGSVAYLMLARSIIKGRAAVGAR
ncbi:MULTISPECIES: Bcr/CflA family efflux MFS transporter [unclassified Halomonas]|uniref:Bcr/CflA family efflux MFS transporter n=1 Tax=unclassified Halomonas TaxID=2609666 RepID=UPI0007DA1D4C|nr:MULTISPECIES: Bcr/CflA family efflux MFS transporter [unclassified Halomonas]MBT2787758.1 Bcr/CflA family efflux MFS transporter [Halomonas sp. ISL-106]MBT2799631.1 Bcr/CflA family efflux MFS transporter [Halomonas sp. ISL-104]OAL61410.1 Bcr/CflA family drug resistance efflux transporter [Halomonas sp. ALS9]